MAGDAPANLWLISGTWRSSWCSLSPPPWYPPVGSEVRWELTSKAAGAAGAGCPARIRPETLSQIPWVHWGPGEGRGSPARCRRDARLPPLCSDASLETGFGAETMLPHCPTESRQPGTNPCACCSRWHLIPGASGSSPAKLAWHEPLYQLNTASTRGNGHAVVPGERSRAARGIVATWPGRSRVSRVLRGILPLPGHRRLASARHPAATTGSGTWP